jgi:hypothetical protein
LSNVLGRGSGRLCGGHFENRFLRRFFRQRRNRLARRVSKGALALCPPIRNIDAVSCERMVGALRFAHSTDSAGGHKFKRIVIHGPPTLPHEGKSAEYFSRNHGKRVFHGTARRHASAAKKPRLAATKITRIPVAFSSPQDFHIELMFGAARFGEPALSGSRRVGFHIAPRRPCSPRRSGTRHKCFNRQRIFDATRAPAAPCGLNACSGAVFRKHRRARDRGLPLVCRKAPEVRRKTSHSGAARWTIQLKCFN